VEPLGRALREALSTPPAELAEMGARGRRYVEREFSWPGVAEKMERTYAWLLGGGPAPDWVRVT
jgi:glycosyltransferase involved in cell wall biosynthesis